MELKKNNGIKNLLKSIVFVVVFSLTLIPVNRIFTPNWTYNADSDETGEGNRYRDFYSMDRDSIDYVVLGASHAFYSLNPMQVYADTGYRGFVLAGGFQPQTCAYYWLREADKYQDLKYVFIDASSLVKDFHRSESILRNLLAMRFSPLKLQAIRDCSPDMDVTYSAFLPLYSFHDRWYELKKEDYVGSEEEAWYYLRGSALRFFAKTDYLTGEVGSTDVVKVNRSGSGDISTEREKKELSSLEKEYFTKSLEYCRENGIELIPVKFPTRSWNDEWNAEVEEFMDSLGLKLLDLHDGEEMGINWEKDSHDNGRHTNYYGNFKTSEYVAEYLKNNTTLKDHSAETDNAALRWNGDLDSYVTWERENVLGRLEPKGQIYQYLGRLAANSDKYLILMAGRKDVTELNDPLSDDIYTLMGMENGFDAEPHKSYVGVVDGGVPVMSYSNDRRIEYAMSWKDEAGKDYELVLTSSGDAAGSACSITVNGDELSFGEKGLNFLVLDRKDGMPLSRAYYGTDSDDKVIFKSENLSAEAAERMNSAPVLAEGEYTLKDSASGDKEFSVTVEDAGNGAVHIRDKDSGAFLTPEKGSNTEGDRVVFENTAGLAASDWIPVPLKEGNLGFFSLYNGYMLSTGDEAGSFKLLSYNDGNKQSFQLRKAG